MSSPDIFLAAGDTAPVTQFQLRQPDDEFGDQGDPLDLTGIGSIVFRYQPKNRGAAHADRVVTVIGDPTQGETELDWGATGGPIAPGDYVCRYIVTTGDGHQVSFPNGNRTASSSADAIDDDDNTFFWLQVAPDFT